MVCPVPRGMVSHSLLRHADLNAHYPSNEFIFNELIGFQYLKKFLNQILNIVSIALVYIHYPFMLDID